MATTYLDKRRRKLGMPRRSLGRLSGLPVKLVRRILTNPTGVRFERVAAVAKVLGVDLFAGTSEPVDQTRERQVDKKARYIARLVQGSQALEAAAVDVSGYARVLAVSAAALRNGESRKLWDD